MHFADITAELKDRFRADLERGDVEWRSPKEADLAKAAADHAKLIAWLRSPAASAPHEKSYPTDDDVERWITETGFASETLFDSIAMYLARGLRWNVTLWFCDSIMNSLNLFTLLRDSAHAAHAKNGPAHGPTKLFWDIFLAFDAGEFYHNNDQSKDPIETYTRPALTKIVEENAGFRYPDPSLSD